MASFEHWITWREEYLQGLRKAINESANKIDVPLNSVDGYYFGAEINVLCCLLNGLGYFVENRPLVFRERLIKWGVLFDESAQKLKRKQLFDYLHSMTKYGLYKLLSDNKFPHAEDLFNAIQDNNFVVFNKICNKENIDFSNVSAIAGYISQGQQLLFVIDELGICLSKNFFLLRLFRGKVDSLLNSFIENQYYNVVRKLLPFDMTEDQTIQFTTSAYHVSTCLDYFEMLDENECAEMNRVLFNPVFTSFMKVVEFVRLSSKTPMPKGLGQYLTREEQAMINSLLIRNPIIGPTSSLPEEEGPGIHNNAQELEAHQETVNISQTSQSTQPADKSTQDIKTLASRWMTEPYHRMSDEVLVELISQKIWPQLINEVDSLQWTPGKRALPTFQKTKNMLAACILFHAMELSKIAKRPKQEALKYNYEGLYGEEDRAQSGVYTTSKIRAGVTSTEKKYNDTLPVGYVVVLEKFIPESEMPGRTTSRTYLKLLNTWVRKRFESIRDNIDSEAEAKLFLAECKQDLGAQFYLYQDNKKQMKAMLTEWRDALPDLFNIPI